MMIEKEKPINKALILICEKCGKKIQGEGENPSQVLQQSLKNEIASTFGKGKVKAVLTTCLSLCPVEKITVVIAPLEGREKTQYYEVSPPNLAELPKLILSKMD